MTSEAVHSHAGKAVTALAELALCVDGDGDPLRIGLRMTLDAADKAVPRPPYASVHRVVPLMDEKAHVIAAHDVGGLHAFFALGRRWYQRKQRAALLRGGSPAEQDQRRQQSEEIQPRRHSPMPISI